MGTEPASAERPSTELDFVAHPELLLRWFESVGDGLFSIDATGKVVAWSRGASAVTGIARDTALGRSCADLAAGEGCESILDWLHAGAEPAHTQFESRVEPRAGQARHVVGNIVALRDDAGELLGAVGSLRSLAEYLGSGRPSEKAPSAKVAPGRAVPDQLLGLVGTSPPMREACRRIHLAADSDVTTLVTGESGTGKELAALALHALSARGRAGRPFLAVNCSALSDGLLESELFGHVRGAFTGAIRDHAGVIERAQGGTLFLDEIGELSPLLQVKLLRVLQERRVRRVGGELDIEVDVRLVTATHRDLRSLLSSGTIREDFYYRIRVYEIAMPSLRERKSDIPLLVDHFCAEFNERYGRDVRGVSAAALHRLLEHDWPGNVRELRNAIEHAFVTVHEGRIEARDLPQELRSGAEPSAARSDDDALAPRDAALSPREVAERERVLATLHAHGWNRVETARALGYSRVTLWKKMRRYRIDEGVFRRG